MEERHRVVYLLLKSGAQGQARACDHGDQAPLDDIKTVGDLGRHYTGEHHLVHQAVEKLYPKEWWLDTHQAEDVAYGLRCIELATGRPRRPHAGTPSRWVVETVA